MENIQNQNSKRGPVNKALLPEKTAIYFKKELGLLNISKESIAKEANCNPRTVYNLLARNHYNRAAHEAIIRILEAASHTDIKACYLKIEISKGRIEKLQTLKSA
ncbi:MAG: hypothetical protein JXR07_04970 [Reichenbachiella sp.]